MKNQILVFSILILFFSCNEKPQENKSKNLFTETKQVKYKEGKSDSLIFDYTNSDTVFIKKDSLHGTAQSIFLEKNKGSKLYERMISFDLDRFGDRYNYNHSNEFFQENKITLIRQKPVISSTKWIILRNYKKNIVAYRPCDFYFYYKVSINDTTFIDWTGEGAVNNKIITQRKINDTTYYFELIGSMEKNRELIIHIIDKQKGIAIFEEVINKTDIFYHLMIAVEKVKSVPLIINNCKIDKQRELKFDEIDYEELLKSKLLRNEPIPNKKFH